MEDWPDQLQRYLQGPDRLIWVVRDIPEAQLDWSLDKNSWSIRHIVHHLADGDDIWSGFIKQALGGQDGEFSLSWYWSMPQDSWVEKWGYASRDIQPSLELYRANREHIGTLLQSAAQPWGFSLNITWVDGTIKKVTVADVIKSQADHLEGHLEDIRQILDTHSSADPSGA
jgi:hypothetical protein